MGNHGPAYDLEAHLRFAPICTPSSNAALDSKSFSPRGQRVVISYVMPRLVNILKPLVWSFLIILILLPHRSHPQQAGLPFESVSLEEGMPTAVQCILQDRTGYLWFATWSGLYKHDGYSFVSYKHDLDDTTSLFENTLSVVFEDKEGVLWIGSYLGLERFDPRSETFVRYTPNPSDTGDNKSNQVSAICEDANGLLWVGSGNGVYQFDRATEKFTCLRHDSTDPGSISHNSVYAIHEDRGGTLWFGTKRGLDKLDDATGKFIHLWEDPNKIITSDPKFWTHSIFEDAAGTIWLGTERGLVECNPRERTFFNYLFIPKDPINSITSICQDGVSGSLWLATTDGLFSFDTKSKTFTHYDSEANYVYGERSGTLWVGTRTELKKLNRTRQPFRKYASKAMVCAVCNGTEGILWMYNNPGWTKFDIRKERFVPYSFGRDSFFYVWNFGSDFSFRTPDGGLYIKDSLGNITLSLDSSWKEYLRSVSFGWKGSKGYWGGCRTGDLYLWEPKTNRVLKVKNLKQSIYWIYEDSFGLLWIATYMDRLFCYNHGKDSLAEFVSDPRNASSLSGKQINHIYEDKKGRLWLATTSGLNRYERSTNSFVHFTKQDGLLSNDIRGILEGDHGWLWLNTSKGISRFDPETHQFKNYDVSYGIEPPTDVFYGVGCKTRNGEMYFGGAKGFTRFHPDSIELNPFIPPIVITSLKTFDRPFRFSGEVCLPHNENFISFEFAALSFVSPERNRYAYMMEGLDKDWVYSGTRRFASYPGLEPGDYVFRVKGSNNDGVWNEAGTSISIVIAPPWWKTLWAYLLYAIMALSLVYVAWKMQMKRIRMIHEYEMSRFEAEKLHEVDEMKSRFFENISHEFRTPLTLILGPVKQIIETTDRESVRNDLRVVHKNANRLLGLVNQLLDISKLESGSMKLRAVLQDFIPLLKALALSFASYAERKRITLTFNSTDDEILTYIDREKIEKIITNILSNAFKFTPEGGRIDVGVTKDEDCVNVRISDTGIGIPVDKILKIFDRFYQVDGSHTREQEGTGIGLSLTKELVELHKGHIGVESEEGKGSTFIVRIPLGKEHLKPEEICEPEPEEERTHPARGQASFMSEETAQQGQATTAKPDIGVITQKEKPLLLIVEDNADVRHYIHNNVKKEYRILEAIDGEDGWQKSIENMPDVIVSDVMMPRMDGFALCEKLKKDERTSHIPVILLTAKASSQDKIEGYQTGADDYIMKPFEPEEVNARIGNLLEQRKRIHEHFRKHGLFEIEGEKITPVDQKFLQNTVAAITEQMSEAGFGVETLAAKMAVSPSVLLKKVEALVGEPPIELIKRTRLNKAAQLIESKFGNISEIALEVGFSNPSYFAECFKKQFGCTPSHYHRIPSER